MRISDIPGRIDGFKKRGQKASQHREGLVETATGEMIAMMECGQAVNGSPIWLYVTDGQDACALLRAGVELDNPRRPCFFVYQAEIDFLRESHFMAVALAKLACIREKLDAKMAASDGRSYVDFEMRDGLLLRVSFRHSAKDWRPANLKHSMEVRDGYVGEVHVEDALLCEDKSQIIALATLRGQLRTAAKSPSAAFTLLHDAQTRTIREQEGSYEQPRAPRRRRRRVVSLATASGSRRAESPAFSLRS